jgi:hypothetical protein
MDIYRHLLHQTLEAAGPLKEFQSRKVVNMLSTSKTGNVSTLTTVQMEGRNVPRRK